MFQVLELDPFTLCPSSAEGGEKEQLLQVICLVLAVFNMFVFSKLLYDYQQYKNTGKLPGIIYWIPFLWYWENIPLLYICQIYEYDEEGNMEKKDKKN